MPAHYSNIGRLGSLAGPGLAGRDGRVVSLGLLRTNLLAGPCLNSIAGCLPVGCQLQRFPRFEKSAPACRGIPGLAKISAVEAMRNSPLILQFNVTHSDFFLAGCCRLRVVSYSLRQDSVPGSVECKW